jgi:DNA-binding winged helix-turn-helix (wHTH) protein
MQAEQTLSFGLYRLAPTSGQVWRGTHEVKLTPKALAVLCALVQQPGQVVSKEELFRTVWPDTVVSDAALTVCIQELRHLLRDAARKPRYIETVHRRGFRFIAPLTTAQPVQGSKFKVQSSKSEPTPYTRHPTPSLVGRETELAQLHHCLAKALQGERQFIFIIGEPGIGKTSLVDAFLQSLASRVQNHEERQKPVLSPSATLRINSVEGAKSKRQKYPAPNTQHLGGGGAGG